jgi:hypothetical protein
MATLFLLFKRRENRETFLSCIRIVCVKNEFRLKSFAFLDIFVTVARDFAKILFSFVFVFTFFVKIMFFLAPFIVKSFDYQLNAMSMQVEDDPEPTPEEAEPKKAGKDYYYIHSSLDFAFHPEALNVQLFGLEEDSHRQTFFPTVPTPPPNS